MSNEKLLFALVLQSFYIINPMSNALNIGNLIFDQYHSRLGSSTLVALEEEHSTYLLNLYEEEENWERQEDGQMPHI